MFTGERVRLRAYREEDIDPAWALFGNPELIDFLSPMVHAPYTWEDEARFIRGQSGNKDEYNFAVETLDGTYIGGCGISAWDARNRCALVGIAIADPAYWGKGYGTDAMRVLIRYLFRVMDAHRVELGVYASNPRAVRSYEKVGFQMEGASRMTKYTNGKYVDTYTMGILRHEWEARYAEEAVTC